MSDYTQSYKEESDYLESVLDCVKSRLAESETVTSERRRQMTEAGREMWEDSVHFTNDFERLTEVGQHLAEVTRRTFGYVNSSGEVEKYRRLLDSPYFGRFDFVEDGYGLEKIYVGVGTVEDPKTRRVLVYDWRAPVSSIFYRFELGSAHYTAPAGTISGEVSLKRQYKIEDSKLKYFFDCSVRIGDDILQEALSSNASPQMRSIVETIQKEQDVVIRDTEHDLLMVQGAAGSGKTSIALHRIAFLLYMGLGQHLSAADICIVSPNDIFSTYISHVLPELGEENVRQVTFDEIAAQLVSDRFVPETRADQLETMIASDGSEQGRLRREEAEFKGSRTFTLILERFLRYYERKLTTFEDLYYAGKTLRTRQQLKNLFLADKMGLPMQRRLNRMEKIILDAVHPLQKDRLGRIEQIVRKGDDHPFDVKPFSRLLAIKATNAALEGLRKSMQIDYAQLYSRFFSDPALFLRLAKGLALPKGIEGIISRTQARLNDARLAYEDCAPLMYLKLKVEGPDPFPGIRHVVVDEAQDYSPLQYAIFAQLFPNARFTVLGDVQQAVAEGVDETVYTAAEEALGKSHPGKLVLGKSYRSSYEISTLARRIAGESRATAAFDRHGEPPAVVGWETRESMDRGVAADIGRFLAEGFSSVAVVCKTQRAASEVHGRLKDLVELKLVDPAEGFLARGPVVISSYAAKGLEFDAVVIYDASAEEYHTPLDRRLMYIACTRALHRLVLHHTGTKSPFLVSPPGPAGSE